MVIDSIQPNFERFPSERLVATQILLIHRNLVKMTMAVGFEFPIEAALKIINLVKIEEALGVQNGLIVGLKQWLLEELPNRKREQCAHSGYLSRFGRKVQFGKPSRFTIRVV